MAQHFKYNTGSTITNTTKKGNFAVAINGSQDWGPTNITGYYPETFPPVSGYTIYNMRATGGPTVHVANNETEAIRFLQSFGSTGSTINDVLNWASAQSNFFVQNGTNTTNIITSGLTLNLDARNLLSYPTTGTTWTNLNGGTNGTLISGVTYSTLGEGSLSFNGTNGYVRGSVNIKNVPFTIICWIYFNVTPTSQTYFSAGNNSLTRQALHLRMVSNTSFLFGMYNDDLTATVSGVTGVWNCFAVTLTSGFVQSIYQNGIFNTSRTAGGYFDGSSTSNIGRFTLPASEYVNANISLVQVYSRALSASEILQNYNAQKSRFGI